MNHVTPFQMRSSILLRRPDINDDVMDDDIPPVLFDEQEDHEDLAMFERIYETSLDE